MSDPEIIKSDLCEEVTLQGKTVQIDIYSDGNNGWILEVIDQYGNSTVWDNCFLTDMEAYNEALETIHTEGISSLVGKPSK